MELTARAPASGSQFAPPGPERRMPDLAGGTAAHAHTVDSALMALQALGVGAQNIRLRRAGRDARQAGAVLRQKPAPGTLLGAGMSIDLEIAGLGFTQALPSGMWDSGGEAAAGTREILEALDDPLEKLKHWFHEGAPLFRLSPEDLGACARWIALFGMQPEAWPEALWYRLASLLAELPQLACSEEGCAFVLGVLLGLPVKGFVYQPVYTSLPQAALSKLTGSASRLGIDMVLGDRIEDVAKTVIQIGPVSLETWELYVETRDGVDLLRHVLELVMPLSTAYELEWLVLDASRPPQLGFAERNGRLGVNSHMGAALPISDEVIPAVGPTLLDAIPGVRRSMETAG